jgi:hypothetical protein
MNNFFNQLEHWNWNKVLLFTLAFGAAWAAVSEIVPPNIFRYVSILLGALSAFLGIITRGVKNVEAPKTTLPLGGPQ